MASRWARFARGWVTALLAVFVAALSHVAGGGGAPGPLSIALALAFSGMLCVALAGRTLSLLRLTVSVAASQGAFHLLFGLGGGTSALTMADSPDHGSMAVIVDTATTATMKHGATHGDGWMWAAHAAAAVVTILALRRGEASYWAVLGYARSLLAVFIASFALFPVRLVVGGAVAARARAALPRDLGVLLAAMRLRGPPARLSIR